MNDVHEKNENSLLNLAIISFFLYMIFSHIHFHTQGKDYVVKDLVKDIVKELVVILNCCSVEQITTVQRLVTENGKYNCY